MSSAATGIIAGVNAAKQAGVEAEFAKLHKACEGFESVFLRMLVSEMNKTVPQDGIFSGSSSIGMYRDIADDYYAIKMAESGGMGLGRSMERVMRTALAAQLGVPGLADAAQTDASKVSREGEAPAEPRPILRDQSYRAEAALLRGGSAGASPSQRVEEMK